jgi:hypothetical protein
MKLLTASQALGVPGRRLTQATILRPLSHFRTFTPRHQPATVEKVEYDPCGERRNPLPDRHLDVLLTV